MASKRLKEATSLLEEEKLYTLNDALDLIKKVAEAVHLKKKKVDILGFKLSGFSELHETLGIFLIFKNIVYLVIKLNKLYQICLLQNL